MRAVVLVGGFGTRLRPLTNDVPKPMLPIGHRPMIERLADRLAAGGVTEITLALGFRPEPFMASFPDGRCGAATLRYAVEPEPLDTAGAIRFAAEFAGIDETFVVVNGDIVTDLDISVLLDHHRSAGAEATIHLTPVDDPSAYGVVELEADGRVLRFVEKPAPGTAPTNLINAGTYVFEPSVLGRIDTGRKVSVEREVFPAVVADGGLYAVATDDYWLDTGTPDTYRRANLDLIDGTRREVVQPLGDHVSLGNDTHVLHSLVGDGCTVGVRVRIVDSVLLPGARVDDDVVIERSLVMGLVGHGATVADSVVGATGVVPAGSALVDARLPEPV